MSTQSQPGSSETPRAGIAAFDLSGRSAVICGASSDMGAAIARALASAGARIVLGDIATEPMERTCELLRAEDA